MENVAILKFKNILRNYWVIFLIIFASMLALSCYQVYQAYITPSFEEKNITVSSYTQNGTYSYSTVVSEPNPLYPTWITLGMNESEYYFAASPIANCSFVYRINASDSANVIAIPTTSIIATRMSGRANDVKILWHKEFPVTSTSSAGPFIVKNEEGINNFTYRFSFNAPVIENTIENTQYRLNYPPTRGSSYYYASDMEYEINTLVTYHGTINGKQIENTTSFVLPMTITESDYGFSSNLSTNVTSYNNETVRLQKPSTVESVKYPLAFIIISIIAIIGIIYCRITYNPDPVLMAKIEQERMHSQFREFISEGKLPENRSSLMALEIASLQELVNAAIDMNERVIHDSSENIHFAIHNGVLYYFTK